MKIEQGPEGKNFRGGLARLCAQAAIRRRTDTNEETLDVASTVAQFTHAFSHGKLTNIIMRPRRNPSLGFCRPGAVS